MQNDILVSLIIPTYNEETCIYDNLVEAETFFSKQKYTYEIVIADDGSSDNTISEVKRFKNDHANKVVILQNAKNKGKGYTVKKAMLSAKGLYRVFTDADFSTPLDELDKMIVFFNEGYEVGIGSRRMQGSLILHKQPFLRRCMGMVFNQCIKLILFNGIEDTQCGFKGFHQVVVNKVFPLLTRDRYSFDVEILYLVMKNNFKIKEFPVQWNHHGNSKIKVVKDSLKAFVDLLIIKTQQY